MDIIAWSQPITLSGRTVVPNTVGAILVDVAGLVELEYSNGKSDTIQLVAGVWHKVDATAINQAGTTATGIHVGYLR